MWPFNSSRKKEDSEDVKEVSSDVKAEVRRKLKEILNRAKERSEKIEEEWRNPAPPDLEDIHYFIDDEEEEMIEPVEVRRKKPRPYRSYAEVVLEEVEKEAKK